MRFRCILCVRRKLCPKTVKMDYSMTKRCPAKLFRIRADKYD